jgi:hypothetical protein
MWIPLAAAAAVLSFSLLPGSAVGQPPAPPPAPCPENCMAKEAQSNYDRVKANILKSADKMPAEDYSFKPTTDIRTFARVLNHVTEAQQHVCGAVNQQTAQQTPHTNDLVAHLSPPVPPETADKVIIVAALKDSFAECDKAYASLTDANMSEMIAAGPVKRSRLGLLWGNASHDNEQYATLALYMRLKGLVPPSSEK